MEILVSVSTRTGGLDSVLWNPTGRTGFEPKSATLMIRGPESVQDLRDTDCGAYCEPIVKWLSTIQLIGSAIPQSVFDDAMEDFAIYIANANTFGIIRQRGEACVEMTMVFTNMPVFHGGLIHSAESLQELTKDVTLPLSWRD